MDVATVVLAVGVSMLAVEFAAGRAGWNRRWPRVPGWWPRAVLANCVQAGSVWLAGQLWDDWLLRQRPWPADGLGPVAGAALGYLVITFVFYWWHRARHEVPLLWRWFHQIHHSPQRIEVITSFYKHPFEIVANSALSSILLYLVVGLDPAAAALAVLATGLAELFYHWNVRTPYWLGFFVQRPESHCVHHQEGLHHYNYADLPVWDALFGTLHNPKTWRARCGFGDRELRLSDMLRGRDVNA